MRAFLQRLGVYFGFVGIDLTDAERREAELELIGRSTLRIVKLAALHGVLLGVFFAAVIAVSAGLGWDSGLKPWSPIGFGGAIIALDLSRDLWMRKQARGSAVDAPTPHDAAQPPR